LYTGFLGVLMPPVAFLQQPIRWLLAIARYKATHCGGPNFGYDLCVSKTTPEQRESLDLSSWCSAYNGAEPMRRETLERFASLFADCGFKASFFYPCYGMAEATLMVSGGLVKDEPIYYQVDADALEENRIVEASGHTEQVKHLVGCGRSWLETKIVIANPESLTLCTPAQVGEIWVSGASVAQGYWNRPEETFQAYLADTREGPFLRTGDLGFLKDGELFVTGRLKDLIIIRGRNHYPQDVELTVEKSHPALRPNCGAAFAVEVDGVERLVIAQEVERSYLRKLKVDEVVEAIRREVSQEHELQVYAVLMLSTGSIPKTSSGKIQRRACRTGYLENSLKVVGSWQMPPQEEPGESVNNSEPLASKKSLHNFLYQGLVIEPVVKEEITSTNNSSTQESRSQARADELIEWLRRYASKRINSRLIDERRCIPPYIVLDLGNRGILGMQVPEQYGGMALNNYDTLRVFEQVAAIDLTLASFIGVNHVLGTRPIANYAKTNVQDELLPLIARGRELAAFAITEPAAGSHPKAISATAVPDSRGGWRLRGKKIWIGSGSWAGSINVFVQLQDSRQKPLGITGFVVRQGADGLEQGAEALTMGMRGMVQNSVYLNDVLVSSENLLGQPGAGMEVAQDAMMFGRLGLGAISLGGMKRCAQLMLRYASRRSISTGNLLDNPVTLARLNDLTAAITSLEILVARIAKLLDKGCSIPEEAYIVCKTSGPEFLWKAADYLVQLLGGRGYIETNIAPQILRDARLMRIFEGPTETLNMFLGSRVINNSEEINQFICNGLEAPMVADSLRSAAQQIYERCMSNHGLFSDRIAAARWAYVITGEIATLAIMLAAMEGVSQKYQSTRLTRAINWTRLNFEDLLAKALFLKPDESRISSADLMADEISSYSETIGDIEQNLAGEDRELDELLQKKSSSNISDKPTKIHAEVLLDKQGFNLENKDNNQTLKSSDRTFESIKNWIISWLSKNLKIASSSIDTSKSFADYGMDSVMAIDLAQDLESWLKHAIEPTVVWNYSTIENLGHYLASEIGTKGSGSDVGSSQEDKLHKNLDESVPASEKLEAFSETEIAELLAEEIAKAKQIKSK